VNGCHSLLIMLLENPNADYLLFDLNYHKYTEPSINYIKESFLETKINTVVSRKLGKFLYKTRVIKRFFYNFRCNIFFSY
jgi:hypothetical protein